MTMRLSGCQLPGFLQAQENGQKTNRAVYRDEAQNLSNSVFMPQQKAGCMFLAFQMFVKHWILQLLCVYKIPQS